MAVNRNCLALEINDLDVWLLVCMIVPHFRELNFQENLWSFLVFDFDGDGVPSLMTPETVAKNFDYIQPKTLKAKFVTLVK